MIVSNSNFYQVGASLPVDAPSYVKRQADEEFYQKLRDGKFCYVLNSRQMGKSSLRVQTMERLQKEGTVCAAIDLTGIGKVSQQQWYGGIVYNLSESCQLEDKFDFDWQEWWQKHQTVLSPVQCLSLFVEKVLLAKIQQPIVIFVDEIDKVLSQDFSADDFFGLIRFFQNQRVDNPIFQRLTFALLGVATPGDLIQNKTQTPFNIGEAIELHGFKFDEVEPLIDGLRGKCDRSQVVMKEILDWTGGQPFLTQKLCKFMVEESEKDNPVSVEEVVKSRIIENWESQDDPEHLRTIRDRVLWGAGQYKCRLLSIYKEILETEKLSSRKTEISEVRTTHIDISEKVYLRLSGLVVEQQNKLRVYNRIYKSIFNLNWANKELKNIRPDFYNRAFYAWLQANCKDNSHLLQKQNLIDALAWAESKSLSNQDYQFINASLKWEFAEVQKKTQRQILIGITILGMSIAGVIIAVVTAGIVNQEKQAAISSLNKAQEERQKANQETKTAKKQTATIKQQAEITKKDLKEAREKQTQAKKDLQAINRSLQAANTKQRLTQAQLNKTIKQQARTQALLQSTETKLKQAVISTRNANYELQSTIDERGKQLKEIKQLRQERKRLYAEAKTALAQIKKRDRQLAKRQDAIEKRDQKINRLDKQIQERNSEIAVRDKIIVQRQKVINQKQARLSELERQQYSLEQQLAKLGQSNRDLRLGKLELRRGQVIAEAVVRVEKPDAAKEAVIKLLQSANRSALKQLSEPGSNSSSAEKSILFATAKQIEQLSKQIDDGREYVVRIFSAGNYVRGEKRIEFFADAQRNQVVFQGGEVLATTTADPTAMIPDQIRQRLELLISASQFRARGAGILQSVQIEDGTFIGFEAELRQYGKSLDVKAVASGDAYRAGPLKVKLVAILNGQIVFSTGDRNFQSLSHDKLKI